MSNQAIPNAHETGEVSTVSHPLAARVLSNTVGPFGIEALPASTPEYAPAGQVFVEEPGATTAGEKGEENTPSQGKKEKRGEGSIQEARADQSEINSLLGNATTVPPLPTTQSESASSSSPAISLLEKQAYDLMVQVVSRDPRFELNHNVRQVLQEVQHLRARTPEAGSDTNNTDLAMIRETVQNIWTHLQNEANQSAANQTGEGQKAGPESKDPGTEVETPVSNISPTQELINETRALVRSVNEEVNATRNNTIQLTNQVRTAMDVATRCLREMDKTAVKYEQKGETGPLLDELRSLRDMLADGFENARLEPIAPEPGEAFRYNEHRPENGFAASGKIKRTLYPGFRWMQPTPPVVLLPALVETE